MTATPGALTEYPVHITEVCATGDHDTCIGTVYIWPPPETGSCLARCECPVCDHDTPHLKE